MPSRVMNWTCCTKAFRSFRARTAPLAGLPVEGDDGFSVPLGSDPFSLENERAFRAWAEVQALIDYAGHAAVVALLGIGDMSEPSAARHGAGPDFQKARKRLGNDKARVQAGKDLALAIIHARKSDVKKLANAVLKYDQIGSQEVGFVLTDSPFLQESLEHRAAPRLRVVAGAKEAA